MNKLKNACCMACINWRATQNGNGECMSIRIWTEESFGCTDFIEGEYQSN